MSTRIPPFSRRALLGRAAVVAPATLLGIAHTMLRPQKPTYGEPAGPQRHA